MPRMVESPTRFPFTQKALDQVAPPPPGSPSAQAEVCDAQCAGLRFAVSGASGRRFWYYRYRYRQRKRCLKIGEYPGVTLREAREKAWDMKAMLARGEDPAAWKAEQAAVPTFREFVEDRYAPHARATVRRYDVIESRLKTGALPWFGDMRLDAITAEDVSRFHAATRARLSPATANHHLIALKRILNLAVEWGVLEKSPAKAAKKYLDAGARDRYLNGDELKRFIAALDTCDNAPVAEGLRMLLLTGLRAREVFDLAWADVDEENRSVLLRKTKAGKPRRVSLSNAAWAVIERMRALREGGHPYVFPGLKPNTPVLQPHRCFRGILKQAKIEDFKLHDLRHTFASYMVQSGASLFEVQKALGHADSSMTQRYAHLADAGLRDKAERAAARLTGTDG